MTLPQLHLQVATEVVLGSNLETWIVHCRRDKEVRSAQLISSAAGMNCSIAQHEPVLVLSVC